MVYALTPAGSLLWQHSLPPAGGSTLFVGAIAIAVRQRDDAVYVGLQNTFSSLSSASGSLKWRYTSSAPPTQQWYSPPTIDSNGVVYSGSQDLNLYAFFPSGSLKWQFPFDDYVWSSPVLPSDGRIIIYNTDGQLYSLGNAPDASRAPSLRPSPAPPTNSSGAVTDTLGAVTSSDAFISVVVVGIFLLLGAAIGLVFLSLRASHAGADDDEDDDEERPDSGKGRASEFEMIVAMSKTHARSGSGRGSAGAVVDMEREGEGGGDWARRGDGQESFKSASLDEKDALEFERDKGAFGVYLEPQP